MHRAGVLLGSIVLVAVAACGKPPAPPAAPTPPAEAPAGSEVAWTLDQRDLLPENIAFDPLEETFYVGSSRHGKIVKVTGDGRASDFVGPRQDGLWMVMGMKVDAERRHLWVASSDGDNLAGYARARSRPAGVFQFDLADGSLLGRWLLDGSGGTHFFNDLVVSPEGDVYITHMFNQAAIYIVSAGSRELEVFARPGNFRAPNGIALGPDGTVYVSHREGLSAFDPATAERRLLPVPEGSSFSPVDGLYYHRGALIGVHPEESKLRRFTLDPAGRGVSSIDVLEAGHPAIAGLTTGVVIDDTFYFVANSQFDRLADGALPSREELDDIVVLRLPLG